MIKLLNFEELFQAYKEPARSIMTLRYIDNRPLNEVADFMNIDPKFISRIEQVTIDHIDANNTIYS